MALKYNGQVKFGANFNMAISAPLDTRAIISTFDDLAIANSIIFTDFVYKGMIVTCEDTLKTWVLESIGERVSITREEGFYVGDINPYPSDYILDAEDGKLYEKTANGEKGDLLTTITGRSLVWKEVGAETDLSDYWTSDATKDYLTSYYYTTDDVYTKSEVNELYNKTVATKEDLLAFATTKTIGQHVYLTTNIVEGETEVYSSGLYVVVGEGSLQKLATSSATGDFGSDIAELNAKVSKINDNLTDLNSYAESHEQSISEIGISIESINGDITGINGAISDINGDITDINGAIGDINDTISKIDSGKVSKKYDIAYVDQTGAPSVVKDGLTLEVAYANGNVTGVELTTNGYITTKDYVDAAIANNKIDFPKGDSSDTISIITGGVGEAAIVDEGTISVSYADGKSTVAVNFGDNIIATKQYVDDNCVNAIEEVLGDINNITGALNINTLTYDGKPSTSTFNVSFDVENNTIDFIGNDANIFTSKEYVDEQDAKVLADANKFTSDEIAKLIGSEELSETFMTLKEISKWLDNDPNAGAELTISLAELTEKVNGIEENFDNYYTSSQTDKQIADAISAIPAVDLTSYATKTYADNAANAAEKSAKDYVDSKLTWMTIE